MIETTSYDFQLKITANNLSKRALQIVFVSETFEHYLENCFKNTKVHCACTCIKDIVHLQLKYHLHKENLFFPGTNLKVCLDVAICL